jgi:Domain of unknown function (DU1801)
LPYANARGAGKMNGDGEMAKAENKTQPTALSFDAFLATVPDPRRQDEARTLDALFRRVTGQEPLLWGASIVGYGRYRYHYESGREGEWCRAGFSPRKAQLVVYLMGQYSEHQAEADALFARLGKHKMGKSCLYITRLAVVDLDALEALIALDWAVMNARYPE